MSAKSLLSCRQTQARWAIALLFLVVGILPAAAQQLTRVAVIDMSRVMAAFTKDSAALKSFEQKKAEIQAEVDKRAAEIKSLQAKKTEAQSRQDSELVRSLDSEIAKKTAELKEYVAARQNELDIMAKALSSSASFLQKVNDTIAKVAASEGYSLVLNLKSQDPNSIVLWSSSSIDITDEVILALSQSQ